MKNDKWYNKLWVWMAIIAFTLIFAVLLFIFYLYKLKYINLIDIRFAFTNNSGNYDWGIFWSFVEALGSVVVGILAYNLSKKLKKLEDKKLQLDTQPFLMIGQINFFETNALIKNSKLVGFRDLSDGMPYFIDTTSKIMFTNKQIAFEIELINVSKVFNRVVLKELIAFENKDNITMKFNGSTINIKSRDLFIEQGKSEKFAFISNELDREKYKGNEVELKVIIRNNYGESYEQLLNFYILGLDNNNVRYGMKESNIPIKTHEAE